MRATLAARHSHLREEVSLAVRLQLVAELLQRTPAEDLPSASITLARASLPAEVGTVRTLAGQLARRYGLSEEVDVAADSITVRFSRLCTAREPVSKESYSDLQMGQTQW